LKDLRFDYILANPPFNISDWGGERLREDARWTYGAPPVGNANYAWLEHILWHLAPKGTAGVVLANGSMSSAQSGEDTIRKAMVGADAVDCMVALPGQLFYSTQIPACLWFLARNKNSGSKMRDRRGEVLFIDARKLGTLGKARYPVNRFDGMEKTPMSAQLRLGEPRKVNRSVPIRPANAELRPREYLTEAEVENLIKATRNSRYGHRDATLILIAFPRRRSATRTRRC